VSKRKYNFSRNITLYHEVPVEALTEYGVPRWMEERARFSTRQWTAKAIHYDGFGT
jgi:hypothetical protein